MPKSYTWNKDLLANKSDKFFIGNPTNCWNVQVGDNLLNATLDFNGASDDVLSGNAMLAMMGGNYGLQRFNNVSLEMVYWALLFAGDSETSSYKCYVDCYTMPDSPGAGGGLLVFTAFYDQATQAHTLTWDPYFVSQGKTYTFIGFNDFPEHKDVELNLAGNPVAFQSMYEAIQLRSATAGQWFGCDYLHEQLKAVTSSLSSLGEQIAQGGGGGTTNYNELTNKPSIDNVVLTGNQTASSLALGSAADIQGLKTTKSDIYNTTIDSTPTAVDCRWLYMNMPSGGTGTGYGYVPLTASDITTTYLYDDPNAPFNGTMGYLIGDNRTYTTYLCCRFNCQFGALNSGTYGIQSDAFNNETLTPTVGYSAYATVSSGMFLGYLSVDIPQQANPVLAWIRVPTFTPVNVPYNNTISLLEYPSADWVTTQLYIPGTPGVYDNPAQNYIHRFIYLAGLDVTLNPSTWAAGIPVYADYSYSAPGEGVIVNTNSSLHYAGVIAGNNPDTKSIKYGWVEVLY